MELRESFLFRLECDPPAYLWSGVGDLIVDGDTYLGGGELLSGLPEIQQLINGTASRVDFSVSGVDLDAVRLALEDYDTVKGALVRIGTVPMNAAWQIIGPVDWEWEGVADVVNIDRSASENGEVTRTISVSVGSADTARSRNQLTLFTNADQRSRSPDDAFFSHVGGITAGTSRRFEATT